MYRAVNTTCVMTSMLLQFILGRSLEDPNLYPPTISCWLHNLVSFLPRPKCFVYLLYLDSLCIFSPFVCTLKHSPTLLPSGKELVRLTFVICSCHQASLERRQFRETHHWHTHTSLPICARTAGQNSIWPKFCWFLFWDFGQILWPFAVAERVHTVFRS